jgi:transposase
MIEYTEKAYAEITLAVKNQPARGIARKIMAIKMLMEKQNLEEISKMTGYNKKYIYEIVAKYHRTGMESLCDKRVGGNHRSFSKAKEAELFEEIKEEAQKGKFPRAKEIKKKIEAAALFYAFDWRRSFLPYLQRPRFA